MNSNSCRANPALRQFSKNRSARPDREPWTAGLCGRARTIEPQRRFQIRRRWQGRRQRS